VTRGFSVWKAQATLKLLALKAKHRDNPKIAQDVDVLVTKLLHLKLRDLASFLVLVHHASADCEEFLSVLPSEEEVEEWYGRGEEE
jgi:hypothetical protein